jgi:4-hydroxybenzoate polyprenyltransferase
MVAQVLLAYLGIALFYSMFLKHRVLLDVIIIAVLFVLRAVAGALAISVPISPWLLVCTFMLCLFMGFGKRRCEIAAISNAEGQAVNHRSVLDRYTPDLLNQLLSTSGGIAIVTFLLYTLDTAPSPIHKQRLLYTLPLVVYGIYRYAMLVELGAATGPTELIIKDRPFLLTLALWVVTALIALYWPWAKA